MGKGGYEPVGHDVGRMPKGRSRGAGSAPHFGEGGGHLMRGGNGAMVVRHAQRRVRARPAAGPVS